MDDETFDGLLNMRRVGPWLEEHLGVDGSLDVQRISTGHSNEMFRIRAGGASWVLRRPPRVRAHSSASNMAREYRVLSALDGTDVPHPHPVALCEDEDLTGVPFFVMNLVEGFKGLPSDLPEEFRDSVEAGRELCFALADALARIHRVDWRERGLEGFGRPDGFLDRQVERWLSQLDQYRVRELPHLDEVADWLRTHRPPAALTGIMHGDYSGGNVLFAFGRPGRVAAVVDWENCTIGDPLLDLANFTRAFPESDVDRKPVELAPGDHPRLNSLPDVPTRPELIAHWCEVSGFPVPDLTYYDVLGAFKSACVLEGSYARYVQGESQDPYHATFEVRVPAMLAGAAARIATAPA
jgi:aminoglycoside phosphotransferase (APT) family kinase protein